MNFATPAANLGGRIPFVDFDEVFSAFVQLVFEDVEELSIAVVHGVFSKVHFFSGNLIHIQILYADDILIIGNLLGKIMKGIHPLVGNMTATLGYASLLFLIPVGSYLFS